MVFLITVLGGMSGAIIAVMLADFMQIEGIWEALFVVASGLIAAIVCGGINAIIAYLDEIAKSIRQDATI
jgi:hypothetical protein